MSRLAHGWGTAPGSLCHLAACPRGQTAFNLGRAAETSVPWESHGGGRITGIRAPQAREGSLASGGTFSVLQQ